MIPHEFHTGWLAPQAQDRYRAVSATPPIVLIRKRCACGAMVSAKQLVQYGGCEKCAKCANEKTKPEQQQLSGPLSTRLWE